MRLSKSAALEEVREVTLAKFCAVPMCFHVKDSDMLMEVLLGNGTQKHLNNNEH